MPVTGSRSSSLEGAAVRETSVCVPIALADWQAPPDDAMRRDAVGGLERGDVVIQDRYLDSSVAYQGAGRVLDADEVRDLSLWAADGLLPQVTVLLDLDPTAARARLDADDKPFDRLEAEKHDFHARVRSAFLALAASEPERFLVLDASRPVDEIAAAIRERVSSVL